MHAKSHVTDTDTIQIRLLNAEKGKKVVVAIVKGQQGAEKLEHVESNPYYVFLVDIFAKPC